MPTLLSDPSTTTYVLLGLAAAAAGFGWVRTRTRTSLRVFAALVGLVALVAGVDYFVESPREEAVRRVRLMEAAINARDWAALAGHLSEQFKFRTFTKAAFRDKVSAAGADVRVHFTAFDRDQVEYQPGGAVKIGFAGQADSPRFPQRGAVYIEAMFAPDPDGVLRMQSVEAFNYIKRRDPESIPGL